MKTIYFGTYQYTPEEVFKAFCHVKEHFPNLQKVEYNEDGQWNYVNADGSTPEFDSRIDVSLLEAASDRAYSTGYPVCFSLFVETEIAVCNVPGKSKVTITQIGVDKFNVTVCPGESTTWNSLESALGEFTESVLFVMYY